MIASIGIVLVLLVGAYFTGILNPITTNSNSQTSLLTSKNKSQSTIPNFEKIIPSTPPVQPKSIPQQTIESNSQQATTVPDQQQKIHPNLDNLIAHVLQVINQDRQKNGLPPVLLSSNQEAQQHAEDNLKTRQISHWLQNGEKPYMLYTQLGGLGYVAQNVAYDGYASIAECQQIGTICNKIDPLTSITSGENSMMTNDAASNWGHRDNILDKHHTHVSIGIAYDDYTFFMVQNFENQYIDYDSPMKENNGIVSFSGNLKSGSIQGMGIYYDPTPTSELYQEHKKDGFYEMGGEILTVQPPAAPGTFYAPSNDTFEIADKWVSQGNHVDISFDISPLVTKSGVYTVVVYLQDAKGQFPATSYSIIKASPMVQTGFESPKIMYACTSNQLEQYNQLQLQHDALSKQYTAMPQMATSNQEYQKDMQMYNQLNAIENQLRNFRC